jgi:hypothetical protein
MGVLPLTHGARRKTAFGPAINPAHHLIDIHRF